MIFSCDHHKHVSGRVVEMLVDVNEEKRLQLPGLREFEDEMTHNRGVCAFIGSEHTLTHNYTICWVP